LWGLSIGFEKFFLPLGEALVELFALTIPLVCVLGELLVHRIALDKNCHFNQCIRKGSVFLDVFGVFGDVSIDSFGRGGARLTASTNELMLVTETLITSLMGDSLQSH
jgi:hypothetical protein